MFEEKLIKKFSMFTKICCHKSKRKSFPKSSQLKQVASLKENPRKRNPVFGQCWGTIFEIELTAFWRISTEIVVIKRITLISSFPQFSKK